VSVNVRRLGRWLWVVGEVGVAVLATLLALFDGLAFAMGFGSAPGSYTGQDGDRTVAVGLLVWGVIPSVLVAAAAGWVEIRRFRSRRPLPNGRGRSR
jgi:hypothetical protein